MFLKKIGVQNFKTNQKRSDHLHPIVATMSRLKKNLFVHTYPHLAADKATKEQSRPRRSPEKISHKENEKPKLLKSWTEEQRMHFMKLHVDEKRPYQESLVRWKRKFRTVDPPARSTASGWKAMYEETNGQKTCKEGRPGQPKIP